jgi:transposase
VLPRQRAPTECIRSGNRVVTARLTGSLFVFANRNATRLKALWFDSNGYCLLYKRLHRAVFELPPSAGGAAVQINSAQLAALLRGDPRAGCEKATASATPRLDR